MATEAPDPLRADPLRTGSLRRRVVVPILALLLAVIVTIVLIVNVILSRRLHDDARNQITERARYAATLSSRGLTAQDLADDLTGQGITASVVRDGTVVVGRDSPPPQGPGAGTAGRPNGPGGAVPSGAPSGAPGGGSAPGGIRPTGAPPGGSGTGPGSAVTIAVHETGQALTVTLGLPDGGGKLQLVSSLAEIDRTLTLLHRVELGTAGGTLVIAAVALVFLAGAALSPLRRMRVVADRIRDGARGERLRPTRPGTDLGRTALAFDDMLDELESAEARARGAQEGMRRLLADVSHDLRTPVAGMITTAEQLLQHDPGRHAREAGLVDLIREGRRAARLVDDLLLVTRLDAGETVSGGPDGQADAETVLTAAVEALRRRRPDRQVTLSTAPATVGLDPDRLTRIVTNLLDNAGAATGPGGSVVARLQVGGSGTSDATVVIEIDDDGPGIPDGYGERIFDRLFRLDPSRHAGGSGLGLPIARGLARTVGGEVRYVGPTGADGSGARFRVELPAGPDRHGP